MIILRVRSDALSLFLSFGLSLRHGRFVCSPSFVLSFFWLLTKMSQLTEGNDKQPESFLLPVKNGFKNFFANQRKLKKKSHHNETSSCVSRAIAKQSSWVVRGAREGAKRQCYVAVNISYFSCLFSRADIEQHRVQPESLSYHSKLKWLFLQSQSCYYASSKRSKFSP